MAGARSDERADAPCLLWICRGDERYGVARGVIDLSSELGRRGWYIALLHSEEGPLVETFAEEGWTTRRVALEHPHVKVTGAPLQRVWRLYRVGLTNADYTRAFDAADLELPGTVRVVQTFSQVMIPATGDIARHLGALGVWRTARAVQSRTVLKLERWFLHRQLSARQMLAMATSAFTADALGSGAARVVVNHHGCDARRFAQAPAAPLTRREFGIGAEEVVFAIVARLYPNDAKGQLAFTHALARTAGPRRTLHLLLLGGPTDGEFPARLRDAAAGNAALTVHLCGHTDAVERYYGIIDVAVNACPTPEPFGLSVIEAMTAGVPALVHASGGPAETVLPGVTGWFAQAPSIAAWEAAIAQVLVDRPRWAEMGAAAREHALARYTLARETDRWLAATAAASEPLR